MNWIDYLENYQISPSILLKLHFSPLSFQKLHFGPLYQVYFKTVLFCQNDPNIQLNLQFWEFEMNYIKNYKLVLVFCGIYKNAPAHIYHKYAYFHHNNHK